MTTTFQKVQGVTPLVFRPEIIKELHRIGDAPVAPPVKLRPQIFLVEQYKLVSFKGDLARDDMINSFSISPNSEFTYTLITKTSTTTSNELTTTVMESQDSTAANQFNKSMKDSADSKYGQDSSNYQLDANFHGEAQMGFGGGSADASLNVKGGSQDVRQELAKSAESAIDSQISSTNQFRTQKAVSGTQSTQMTNSTETRSEKKTRNDTSNPVNIGVFQLKEETITLLCLVDVLIEFRNTDPAKNLSVPVREIDALLNKVVGSVDMRKSLKAQILETLQSVRDYQDQPHSLLIPDQLNPSNLAVNQRLESTYELKSPDGSTRRKLVAPGIIIRDYKRYLRKPCTTVELRLDTI
ncbi:hypothetical protein AWB78_07704 [Caballeronia calidae]|uniref:Uncharacterized protein n=1 Tax=Caballeronia calidae TaxID=1777139 RepID=A0A158EG54_9BURK|nr:hypothetical protein [Caballeronia calidae]SAL05794.1 hypothetical protein AWB78_07704 [Caballeronia calidae]